MTHHPSRTDHEVSPAVAVIPAAGKGRRVAPLPGSKEVLPVGTQRMNDCEGPRARVISQHLLEALKNGGVDTAYWVLREGKWDIPSYWGDGRMVGLHCAYLMARSSYGVPFTIDQAYPFVKDRVVVLGFPDILFQPKDAFRHLRRELERSGDDVVLGCMPADNPSSVDMVDLADDGSVQGILVKPASTTLTSAWCIAAWRPTFSRWLHTWIERVLSDPEQRKEVRSEEHQIGHLFQKALRDGLSFGSVLFPEGEFFDVGTPESLERAMSTSIRASMSVGETRH